MTAQGPARGRVAPALLEALGGRGWTVAVAESLTGGLVISALVDIPGASRTVRGGVVAYSTDLKARLLGVDVRLLASKGAVDPDVAIEMARGVRERLGADVGVATTGVAGPDPQDGHPPGTVHVAVVTAEGVRSTSVQLRGDRRAVREAARDLVLALALEVVEGSGTAHDPSALETV